MGQTSKGKRKKVKEKGGGRKSLTTSPSVGELEPKGLGVENRGEEARELRKKRRSAIEAGTEKCFCERKGG